MVWIEWFTYFWDMPFFDLVVMIWNCATDLSPLIIHTTYLRKMKFKFHSMIKWLTCFWFPIVFVQFWYILFFRNKQKIMITTYDFQCELRSKISNNFDLLLQFQKKFLRVWSRYLHQFVIGHIRRQLFVSLKSNLWKWRTIMIQQKIGERLNSFHLIHKWNTKTGEEGWNKHL